MSHVNRSPKRFLALPRWLIVVLAGSMMLTGCFLVSAGALFYLNFQTAANTTIPLIPAIVPTEFPEFEAAVIPTVEWLQLLETTDRLTVLVMGVDSRPGESLQARTDSMMVLSLNPEDNTASILSIPRDLYVTMPDGRRNRINTALAYGASGATIQDGGKYAIEVIQNNLGIPIDHYLILDFQTVVDIINNVGGIIVDVPFDIDDPTYPDMNYGYDPLYIPAGEQTLDGETAVKYMRTRHVDSDFGRSQRQQQVILAFRDAIMADGLMGVARNVRSVYSEFQQGVVTDMSLGEMMGLANAGSSIDRSSIQSEVLDARYVYDYTTESGASVLIPYSEEIGILVRELFD